MLGLFRKRKTTNGFTSWHEEDFIGIYDDIDLLIEDIIMPERYGYIQSNRNMFQTEVCTESFVSFVIKNVIENTHYGRCGKQLYEFKNIEEVKNFRKENIYYV